VAQHFKRRGLKCRGIRPCKQYPRIGRGKVDAKIETYQDGARDQAENLDRHAGEEKVEFKKSWKNYLLTKFEDLVTKQAKKGKEKNLPLGTCKQKGKGGESGTAWGARGIESRAGGGDRGVRLTFPCIRSCSHHQTKTKDESQSREGEGKVQTCFLGNTAPACPLLRKGPLGLWCAAKEFNVVGASRRGERENFTPRRTKDQNRKRSVWEKSKQQDNRRVPINKK